MPAGKKQQTSAMLYTLVTFVGLFILATAVAVIYYVKSEDNRTNAANLQNQLNEMATGAELRQLGTIVGAKQPTKSRLGTMLNYLDEAAYMIIGGVPEETSAEVKIDTAKRQFKETLATLAQKYPVSKEAAPAKAAPAQDQNNEIVELLAKNKFTKITEAFDETMKANLPAEKLGEVWKATIEQAGAFKKQIGSRKEKALEYDVIFVTCEFEKGNLDVKLVYNDKKQIAGMFIVPTPEDVVKNYQSKPETPSQGPAQENIAAIDPNTTGLVPVIQQLKTRLDSTTAEATSLKDQLEQLQKRFDDAATANFEKEKTLLAEKEKSQQQVADIKKSYDELRAFVEKTSSQQTKTLMTQLEGERAERQQIQQLLLKTDAELAIAQNRLKQAQEKLMTLMPPPDSEVAAHKADGKIIFVDNQTKVVNLSIGSNDHVYRGLTFSVYDRNVPIPKDGKGKAEVEVFDIAKDFSSARILHSEIKNPIMVDDIVANLIWDSSKTNVFVVEGDFDLDNNGQVDPDGTEKIKALIEKWGGKVADSVTIDTDFIVLGIAPKALGKPTFEQTQIDPLATEKYEKSLKKLDRYYQAQRLGEGTFNTGIQHGAFPVFYRIQGPRRKARLILKTLARQTAQRRWMR